ncbi:hypothetical protein DM860_018003 [Cuscuta australis]|uniref:Endonuclease/exonuclease/phosphatase domain-containing protein n=1 Tax=Cuscuta australis TaxID=267555 RepID=A0A328D096_9ASTE|nr:hypothetical protein DM860_018003 [Cuscuta australis]
MVFQHSTINVGFFGTVMPSSSLKFKKVIKLQLVFLLMFSINPLFTSAQFMASIIELKDLISGTLSLTTIQFIYPGLWEGILMLLPRSWNIRGPAPLVVERSKGRVLRRLDRVLINQAFMDIFSEIYLNHLSKTSSGHKALLLDCITNNYSGPKPFRFINVWTMDATFKDLIRDYWGSTSTALTAACRRTPAATAGHHRTLATTAGLRPPPLASGATAVAGRHLRPPATTAGRRTPAAAACHCWINDQLQPNWETKSDSSSILEEPPAYVCHSDGGENDKPFITSPPPIPFHLDIGRCSKQSISFPKHRKPKKDINSTFTWSGVRSQGRTWHRLDRVLIHLDLLAFFQDVELHHLAKANSDHKPILLHCNDQIPNTLKPFRFLNTWTLHESFLHTVKLTWENSPTIGGSHQALPEPVPSSSYSLS